MSSSLYGSKSLRSRWICAAGGLRQALHLAWTTRLSPRAREYARLRKTGFSHADVAATIAESSSIKALWNSSTHYSVHFPNGLNGHSEEDFETAIHFLLLLSPEEMDEFISQGCATSVAKGITGNRTRDKCIERVYKALASDSGARSSAVGVLLEKAKAIEAVIYADLRGIDEPYPTRMGDLSATLEDENNGSLREAVARGDIQVEKFAKIGMPIA
ncbi:hypothetical protein B0H14DRAFT_3774380 [Mycena olivaceomarginata]|nr:hypothetical protein B0H14DRAFT_3774380 [Mycena olivaceomarginata]